LPQALLAGKPVISYDVDGAREIVIPDETGILLEPRSIQPLAAAITELADDETRRQRLGRAGQQKSRQRFCHEEMTRQIRQLYQQVLDS
jgi:glycosyltransferase involved in cell wall biosynthesis